MRGNKLLKNLDIKIVEQLSKEQHIVVADNVATMISNKFNYIDYGYLYSKLMAAKMYTAKMPEGVTDAIYLYEDDTLIINYIENLDAVSETLLYQCIHALQDVRTKKGIVKQLGQCTFTDFKTYAMALNEASIQYMVAKIMEHEETYAEAYGIRAKTFSVNKYPLICNLLEQLLFLSNEETLVKSTIYSTDDFIVDVVEHISESAFSNVRKNLDDMLYASESIIDTKRKMKQQEDNSDEIEEALNRINNIENLIKKLYTDSQMTIFTLYFDKLFKRIEDLYDIEFYRSELKDYRELIGVDVDKTQTYIMEYFNNYYADKDDQLKKKEHDIETKNELALAVVSTNKIVKIFNMVRATFARIFG